MGTCGRYGRPGGAGDLVIASPSVIVEYLEDVRAWVGARSRVQGRGPADVRCECGWLELQPDRYSVNMSISSKGDATAALGRRRFRALTRAAGWW